MLRAESNAPAKILLNLCRFRLKFHHIRKTSNWVKNETEKHRIFAKLRILLSKQFFNFA